MTALEKLIKSKPELLELAAYLKNVLNQAELLANEKRMQPSPSPY